MTAAARNQAQLGELLGVSQPAVSKLIKSDGWPVKKRGPWSAPEVRKVMDWHATLRPRTDEGAVVPGGGGSDAELNRALKQMNILLKKAQRDNVQLAYEVKKGQLVQREMLDSALGGLADQFIKIIEQLRMNLPRRFKGIDSRALDDLLDAYLIKLANQTEIKARSVDDAIAEARRRAAASKGQASKSKRGGGRKR
jgi:phage terminase Nu1 subunit (DNA packaging protein)